MEKVDPCYKKMVKKAKKVLQKAVTPDLWSQSDPHSDPPSDPSSKTRSWRGIVGPEGSARADVYIAETSGVLSRSQLKARDAVIRVNGAEAKPSRPLKAGDSIELLWTEEDSTMEGEDIPLVILYQDERVIVVDKAQGMVTHPGAGNRHGTLANAALFIAQRESASLPDAAANTASQRPALRPALRAGIVHRLDKDTSGVIIVAKDLDAQVFLAEQFKERLVRKEYFAITRGLPFPASGRIADRLGRDPRERKRFTAIPEGGKAAVTDYRILASWGDAIQYALVSLRPKTGRTHQLRVHMAGLGTPILGDPIYGKKDGRFPEASLMLHAYKLKIALPGKDSPSLFVSPLPRRFQDILGELDSTFGRGSS
jgi:23S rRNA pseudouridine1911/1915/1917 synthase